jgi:hypothetical protein
VERARFTKVLELRIRAGGVLERGDGDPFPETPEPVRCRLEAATFEDLPGKWQAAILKAEQNRPKLHVVTSD